MVFFHREGMVLEIPEEINWNLPSEFAIDRAWECAPKMGAVHNRYQAKCANDLVSMQTRVVPPKPRSLFGWRFFVI